MLTFGAGYLSVAQQSDNVRSLHALVPLGAERIDLSSSGTMYILTTAESPAFEGWRVVNTGTRTLLLTPDGSPVRYYPRHIEFRITATAMRPGMLDIRPYGTLHLSPDEVNAYLLQLGFRLLIFDGLQVTRVEPQSRRQIGMPAEVHYDERVYQIAFDFPTSVPTQDRIVLEVLSPGGSRLCKFHLDLF
jgi:hypothetical protein